MRNMLKSTRKRLFWCTFLTLNISLIISNCSFQFESKQQENGDYFCWQYSLFPPLSRDIVHAMSLPNLWLLERISDVRSSGISISQLRENYKLYKNLKNGEAVQEHRERNISFTCMPSRKNLDTRFMACKDFPHFYFKTQRRI